MPGLATLARSPLVPPPRACLSVVAWIQDAAEPIEGGMSGSPIVTDEGMAIGVVSIAAGFVTDDGRELGRPREGGPNPNLGGNLPGWLLGELIRGGA
jgi:hypothetical protein